MSKENSVGEEEPTHYIEVITKARVSDDGEWEYLVRWVGYDSDIDSWESMENLQECKQLLESFWKHIGVDDNNHPIGYEVAAREDWINEEKQYFAQIFNELPTIHRSLGAIRPKNMSKEDNAEEDTYYVEVITKTRVSDDGEWEYLVRWAGYDSDMDSWEPMEKVQRCNRLLASFWKHVGMDDNDYPIGYEIAAGEDWIEKEKQYFAETFGERPSPFMNRLFFFLP